MNAKFPNQQKQLYAIAKKLEIYSLVRNRIYTRDGNQATFGGGRMRRLKVGSDEGEREERHVLSPPGSGVYDASQVRPTAGSGIRQQ